MMNLPLETKIGKVRKQPNETHPAYQSEGHDIELSQRKYRSEIPGQTENMPPAAQHNNLMDDIDDHLSTVDAQVM